MVALTDACTFAVEKHARMHAYTFTINTLVNLGGVQMFNSQQDVISSIPSLFSLSYIYLYFSLSLYISLFLSIYLLLLCLLPTCPQVLLHLRACSSFLLSLIPSFRPSFIPLLLPPTGTFLIPSFSSFAFLASFPFSLYCKGHTATPHGAVSEYFVGSGVLNSWKKRFLSFSVFPFPFSV